MPVPPPCSSRPPRSPAWPSRSAALARSRSILSVMGLGAKHGETVELTAEGDNADEVLDALVANLQIDPEA